MSVNSKKADGARFGHRGDGHDAAVRLLAKLLREAKVAARVRQELDGDDSDHIEQLIDDLEEHIGSVGRVEASPDPDRFRCWLDSVCSIPAGSPYRWRRASRRPLAPLRPLASTKRASATNGSCQGEPKKIGDETA